MARFPRKPLSWPQGRPPPGCSTGEAGMPSGGKNGNFLALLLAVGMMAAAVALAYFFLMPKPAQQYGGKIEVFPSFGKVLVEGSGASARIFSSCGPFRAFLDGKPLGEFEQRAEVKLAASEGRHVLEAKNSRCSERLEFEVKKAECSGSGAQECAVGNCTGVRACAGGFYSACQLPKKICTPGQKVGCSTNACAFGYKTCNGCGTDYGPCLAPGAGPSCDAANSSCN